MTPERLSSPAGAGGGPHPLGVGAPRRAALLLRRTLARALSIVLPPSLMKDKAFFSVWERRGYHVTPVDPSEPIPDTRRLGEELWRRGSECVGIDFGEVAQLKLLAELASLFKDDTTSCLARRLGGRSSSSSRTLFSDRSTLSSSTP
jgi:hypothetical protein